VVIAILFHRGGWHAQLNDGQASDEALPSFYQVTFAQPVVPKAVPRSTRPTVRDKDIQNGVRRSESQTERAGHHPQVSSLAFGGGPVGRQSAPNSFRASRAN
jgi:hypothetical protein